MNRDIGVDMVQSDGKEKQGSSHHEEAVSVDLAMSTPPARMRGGCPISDCNACENRLSSAVACRPSKAAAKEEGKIGVRELEGSMLVACGGNSGVTEVEGIEIEPGGEGADTQRELAHEVEQGKFGQKQKQKQKEHELLSEEEEHKAQLSSSMAPISNIITHEDCSPQDETSPDVTVAHPRRSDSSRSSLRKPKLVKTRRESKSSLKSPESSEAHDTPGAHETYERGRGEDREDREDFARQSSSSEELNGDGDGDEVMDGTGYRCGMCQEDFDNAKSLNAHKMQHPQNYTLRRNPKRSRRFIDQDYTLEAAQAAPTKKTSSMSEEFPKPCTECGKEFGSWKALFGHMRCHPEREWRGIQPPEKNNCGGPPNGPAQANSRRKKPPPVVVATPIVPVAPNPHEDNAKSGSTESRKAQEDVSKASDNESDTESIEAAYMNGDRQSFTMGWMTGKRSKRSRQTHRSLDAVNSSKRDQSRRESVITPTENSVQSDMIDALMLLQAANKSRERRTLTSTPESQGRVNAHERRVNVVEAEREDPYQREDIRGKHKVDGDDMSLCGDNEDGGDEPDAGEQGGGARTKYECATCKRQFKSHQALGGHRASHKKVKGCYARTNVNEGVYDQSPDEDIADDDFLKSEEQLPHELQDASHNSEEEKSSHYLTIARDDNEEMLNAARKTKGHECSICHRVFNSGQALGGHKRCHWGGGATTGPNEATSSNSSKPMQTLQSGGQQSRGLKEGVLDLNLPAPECLEEMEQAESGLSPLTYGGLAAPAFFLENSTLPRTLFKDSADKGKHINFLQEVELNNQVENQTERLDQFSTLCERSFGSLDTLPGHQKSRVAIMASVPGLTPTSA